MNRRWGLSLAAILAAAVAGPACDEVSDALSADPTKLVGISASTTTAAADGDTRVQITIQVPTTLDVTSRTVTLSTNIGSFVSGSGGSTQLIVDPDTAGFAYAELEAPVRPGTANVQARVASYASTVRIEFQRAAPTRIDVDPGAFAVSATPFVSTTVTAKLLRGSGVASEETAVSFSARGAGGESIGSFSSITLSDASGNSTARYSAGDTSYRGRVVIEARVGNLVGSAPLDVVD